MSEKKTGKISRVAESTGGIQMDGDESTWYNAANDNAKKAAKKWMLHKESELTLDEEGKYTYIKVLGGNEPAGEKRSYAPQGKGPSDYRAMSIAYAKDLVIADKIQMEHIRKVADKIFQYIAEGKIE